jgi:hypothetical protein
MPTEDFDVTCGRQLFALVRSWQTGVRYKVMLKRLEAAGYVPDDTYLYLAHSLRRKTSETFDQYKARRKKDAGEESPAQ